MSTKGIFMKKFLLNQAGIRICWIPIQPITMRHVSPWAVAQQTSGSRELKIFPGSGTHSPSTAHTKEGGKDHD